MKKDPMKETTHTVTNTHFDMLSGFSSAINGANIVVNLAKKFPILNEVVTNDIGNRY